jgi:hypothetical protein
MAKTVKATPKEVNLRGFWPLDVIIEYQPEFQRLVIKKPSGQVTVNVKAQDLR